MSGVGSGPNASRRLWIVVLCITIPSTIKSGFGRKRPPTLRLRIQPQSIDAESQTGKSGVVALLEALPAAAAAAAAFVLLLLLLLLLLPLPLPAIRASCAS
jgi:hypothetical protein